MSNQTADHAASQVPTPFSHVVKPPFYNFTPIQQNHHLKKQKNNYIPMSIESGAKRGRRSVTRT